MRNDDAAQKAVRDAVIGPELYDRCGRYVYLDGSPLASHLQQTYGIDTVMQLPSGRALFIEEKIVRWGPTAPYSAMTLETQSNSVPGNEKPGWMHYTQADLLNYAYCQDDGRVECYLVNFLPLKRAFWAHVNDFKTTITDQENRSVCSIVPIDWIRETVGIRSVRMLQPSPEGVEAVKRYNAGHYKA